MLLGLGWVSDTGVFTFVISKSSYVFGHIPTLMFEDISGIGIEHSTQKEKWKVRKIGMHIKYNSNTVLNPNFLGLAFFFWFLCLSFKKESYHSGTIFVVFSTCLQRGNRKWRLLSYFNWEDHMHNLADRANYTHSRCCIEIVFTR